MLATQTDVLAVAPESSFSTLTNDQWTAAFTIVGAFFNDSVWGTDQRAKTAGALFVAHHLAMMYPSKAGPGAFLASSKRVGEISITYVAPTVDKDVLLLTRWGTMYMQLRKSIPTAMVV